MRGVLLIVVLLFSTHLPAAGGGSMSGGGGVANSPKQTPQQMAVSAYNRALKSRDKAWKYRDQFNASDDAKKRAKLKKKVDKQFSKAVKNYQKAIDLVPNLYQAHGGLGYALKQLGDYENALIAYDASLTLKPDYPEALEYRAEAHLALGRLDEAKAAYIRLMTLDREKADMLLEAIQQWLVAPPAGVDIDTVQAFKAWTAERDSLSQASRDLGGTAAAWSDG